jgi:hypothetical protein
VPSRYARPAESDRARVAGPFSSRCAHTGWVDSRRPKAQRHLPTSPFRPAIEAPVEHFDVSARVGHDTYGLGRVVEVEGSTAVLVDFGTRLERIPSPYHKLRKL